MRRRIPLLFASYLTDPGGISQSPGRWRTASLTRDTTPVASEFGLLPARRRRVWLRFQISSLYCRDGAKFVLVGCVATDANRSDQATLLTNQDTARHGDKTSIGCGCQP